jgi:hypothetical protein
MKEFTLGNGGDGSDIGKSDLPVIPVTASIEDLTTMLTNSKLKGKAKADVIKMIIDMQEEQEHREYQQRLLTGDE